MRRGEAQTSVLLHSRIEADVYHWLRMVARDRGCRTENLVREILRWCYLAETEVLLHRRLATMIREVIEDGFDVIPCRRCYYALPEWPRRRGWK